MSLVTFQPSYVVVYASWPGSRRRTSPISHATWAVSIRSSPVSAFAVSSNGSFSTCHA